MKIATKLAIFIATLAVASLLGEATALAASDYDNLIETVNKIEVAVDTDGVYSNWQDITLDWSTYITDEDKWSNIYFNYPTAKDNFRTNGKESFLQAVQNDGRWGVIQDGPNVRVFWTEDDSLTLNFSSGIVYMTGNNLKGVYIGKPNGDTVSVMPSIQNWGYHSITQDLPFLFFYGNVTYPEGYEGEEIPAELPEEEEEDTIGTAYKPLWMYKVIDKRITLNDLTPNNILEEHKIELCLFQIPTNEWGDTFVEYQYDCLEKPDVKHKFEEYGAYNILHRQYSPTENKWYEISETITIDGSSFSRTSVDLKTCFNEVFPFVHVDKCTDNVKLITNLLSFRTVEFKNIYEIMGCRQLAVIDDWINKPDIILCPQVPQYIRSIITPFVTLLLGLVMIKFITKKEGYL